MALSVRAPYLTPLALDTPTNFRASPFSLRKYNHTSRSIHSFSTSSNLTYKHPTNQGSFQVLYRHSSDEDEEEEFQFNDGVDLFNRREYYKCHDVLEALWNKAEEPARTLIHGILQCAVGFHHLFNQNHKGAMMELGEGLCKLRKMNFQSGPFHQFQEDIAIVLNFLYQTQIELAACGDDMCVAMEQSERSYLLLGGYAAGQHLYHLHTDSNEITHIVFSPQRSNASSSELQKVRLPILEAREEHLTACSYYSYWP